MVVYTLQIMIIMTSVPCRGLAYLNLISSRLSYFFQSIHVPICPFWWRCVGRDYCIRKRASAGRLLQYLHPLHHSTPTSSLSLSSHSSPVRCIVSRINYSLATISSAISLLTFLFTADVSHILQISPSSPQSFGKIVAVVKVPLHLCPGAMFQSSKLPENRHLTRAWTASEVHIMLAFNAGSLQLRCISAVTRRSTQARTLDTPLRHPRATNTSRWQVTICKQQSMQFSLTARRHVGGPSPFTEAELEATRQAVKDGLSLDQILSLMRSEARPSPSIEKLMFAALGPGGLTKHGRQGKSALAKRTPHGREEWPEADLKTLKSYVLGKRSMTKLAALLGRSISSIRYQKNRLLDRLYPWTNYIHGR